MERQNEHRMEVPTRKGVSRIEVLDGPTGRRRWPDEVNERSNAIGPSEIANGSWPRACCRGRGFVMWPRSMG